VIGNAEGAITSISLAAQNAIGAQIGNLGMVGEMTAVVAAAEKVIVAVEDSVNAVVETAVVETAEVETAEVETVVVETAEVETVEVETVVVAAISAATRVDRK
jgi:hypothetical protein